MMRKYGIVSVMLVLMLLVMATSVTAQGVQSLGAVLVNDEDGVLVVAVLDDSLAEELGLEEDDIITSVGDTEVDDIVDLFNALNDYDFGDTVEITVSRDDDEQVIEFTLEEPDEDDLPARPTFEAPELPEIDEDDWPTPPTFEAPELPEIDEDDLPARPTFEAPELPEIDEDDLPAAPPFAGGGSVPGGRPPFGQR
jgi:hypothetical protein